MLEASARAFEEVEQLHKIFKLCGSPFEKYLKKSKLPHATIFKPQQPYERVVAETFKDFPSSALNLLDVLLAIEPEDRGTASSALKSEFFTTKPLPCDPSTLPKFPPSKEFNVKLREEESRRQGAVNNKGHGQESATRSSRKSKAANAELPASIEKRQRQTNSKCTNENHNPLKDGGVGLLIETGRSRNAAGLRKQRSFWNSNDAHLSRFSSSIAAGGGSRFDMSGDSSVNSLWQDDRFSVRYDESNRLLKGPKSSHKKDVHPSAKKPAMGYATKNGSMHYSGPLVSFGGIKICCMVLFCTDLVLSPFDVVLSPFNSKLLAFLQINL